MVRLSQLYKDDGSAATGCHAVFELYMDESCAGTGCHRVLEVGDDDEVVVQGDVLDEDTARQIPNPQPGESAVRVKRHVLTTSVHRLQHPDTYRQIEPFSPEFADLFTSFQHTAFRLETLQRYNDPGEAEALQRFLDGEPVIQTDESGSYGRLVRDARASGKVMQRVHVVTEPLSDYLRFELAVYAGSVDAGEDIRILPVTPGVDLDLPGHDYWLFDSRTLVILRYNTDDQLTTAEVIGDPGSIVRHAYWRDVALTTAIPYATYLARRRAADPRAVKSVAMKEEIGQRVFS
jgi:hypothetical protein